MTCWGGPVYFSRAIHVLYCKRDQWSARTLLFVTLFPHLINSLHLLLPSPPLPSSIGIFSRPTAHPHYSLKLRVYFEEEVGELFGVTTLMSSATHLCGLGSSLWCQISCSRLRFELLLQQCRYLGVLYTKGEKNTKPLWPAWCNSFSQRSFERKGNSPWVQSRLLETKSHLQIPSSICYFCTGFLRSVWTKVWCIFLPRVPASCLPEMPWVTQTWRQADSLYDCVFLPSETTNRLLEVQITINSIDYVIMNSYFKQ